MQSHQQQQHRHQQLQITTTTRGSLKTTSAGGGSTIVSNTHFTNTAKLPIETVKLLIASVSRKPNLWIRTSNGPKRSDINALWQQVGQEVHLPGKLHEKNSIIYIRMYIDVHKHFSIHIFFVRPVVWDIFVFILFTKGRM